MAMSSTLELLQCSICLEIPKNPRRIPCLHVFCRTCLDQLIKSNCNHDGLFHCPNCRFQHVIPKMGVDAFPVAFTPKLQNKTGGQIFKLHCSLHPTHKLSIFCLDCEEAICIQCTRTKHPGHSTVKALDVLRDRRKMLEWASAELNENISDLTSVSESLKSTAETLTSRKEKDASNVMKSAQNIKNTLDSLVKDLIKDLEREYAGIQKTVNNKLQMIERQITETQKFTKLADSVLEDSDGAQLLFNFHALMQQKEKILKHKLTDDLNCMQNLFEKGVCDRKSLKRMTGYIKETAIVAHAKDRSFSAGRPCRYPVLPAIGQRPRTGD